MKKTCSYKSQDMLDMLDIFSSRRTSVAIHVPSAFLGERWRKSTRIIPGMKWVSMLENDKIDTTHKSSIEYGLMSTYMFLMCAILNMFVTHFTEILKIFSRYLILIEAIALFQYIIVLRFLAYFPILIPCWMNKSEFFVMASSFQPICLLGVDQSNFLVTIPTIELKTNQ